MVIYTENKPFISWQQRRRLARLTPGPTSSSPRSEGRAYMPRARRPATRARRTIKNPVADRIKMVIYRATNKINGKQYIGYTSKTLEKRMKIHLYHSRSTHDKHYYYVFATAIRKYGFENFQWEILCNCLTIEECYDKEKKLILKHNTLAPNGYNISKGGNGGALFGIAKEKMINSLRKHYELFKHSSSLTFEQRSVASKLAWKTKVQNGYKPKGKKHIDVSKINMSKTKNEKNKLIWVNLKTNEIKELSCTKMSEYTGLSIGMFSHIVNGRCIKTKSGWTLKSIIDNHEAEAVQ